MRMKKLLYIIVPLAVFLVPVICSAQVLYSQSVTLAPGWNIFSTPRVLDSYSFSAPQTSDNFDIYVLDASQTSGWATMAQEGQTEFTPLYGYFIDNKTGTDQSLTFNYLASTTPAQQLFQRTLTTPGWYSFGIANPTYALPVGSPTTPDTNNPSEILNALAGTYDSVIDFTPSFYSTDPDSVAVGDVWASATQSNIDSLNDFRETKGYAIFTTQTNAPYDGFQDSNIPSPVISSFTASPSSIVNGASTTLSWSVTNATSLSINQGVGTVTGNSISVSPNTTTTYTLTATNNGGNMTSSATVTVTAAPQPDSLTISNGNSPTSQTIVAGGSNVAFASIQLNATQSGENLRISTIPLTLAVNSTANVTTDLSACQLWAPSGTVVNGVTSSAPTALNTSSRVINGTNLSSTTSQTVTFSLDNALTVTTSAIMTLTLQCNLSSSANNNATYQWSADTTTSAWTVTGAVSGTSVTPTIAAGSGPVMTASSGATVAASLDPSSPSYTIVAGGTTGVTASVIQLRATNEPVNLQKLELTLTNAASSSPADLIQVYVYSGNNIDTTTGTAISPGTLLGTTVLHWHCDRGDLDA